MAAEDGRTDPSLEDVLFERGYEFGFFQAARLLALMHPERPLVAGWGQPFDKVARFGAHLSLGFPASAIHSIDRNEGGPIQVTVAFMGLTGPQGVLPEHYTEFLFARKFEKDNAAAAFFDLFNHRFISLFYRAWEKHHFEISWERHRSRHRALGVPPERPDAFTQYLFDLIGMGTQGLANRLEVPDEILLFYGGLIAQRPHSASALGGILRDYFQTAVEIEQFRGAWFPLEQSNLSYLDPEGLHNQLGYGAIAGEAVWNQQARFRIRVGPLSYRRFTQFLPESAAFRELTGLARYFVNKAMGFDVQLILLAAEVPWCQLSGEPGAVQLGWSTWLKTEEFQHDANDAILPAA